MEKLTTICDPIELEIYALLAEFSRQERVHRQRMAQFALGCVLLTLVALTAAGAILHTSGCWAVL